MSDLARAVVLVTLATLAGCAAPPVIPLGLDKALPFQFSGDIVSGPTVSLDEIFPEAVDDEADTGKGRNLTVDCSIVSAPRSVAVALLRDRFLGVEVSSLKAPGAARLIEIFERRPDTSTAYRSTVHTRDGRWRRMPVTSKLSCIRGFELQGVRGAKLADPVIDVAEEGLVLAVRPRVAADGRSIRLDAKLAAVRLIRPLPMVNVTYGGGEMKLTLQAPTHITEKLETAVDLPDGGVVVLAGPTMPDSTEVLLAFLTVRIASAMGP